MRWFVCVVDAAGGGLAENTGLAHESPARARGLTVAWQAYEGAEVMVASDEAKTDALVARCGDHLGVGIVRLDNREAVRGWAGARDTDLTDLALVLRLIASTGVAHIPSVLGDFAFVIWNAATRVAIAVTDAMQVKKLFYRQHAGRVAFASRAEALASDCGYQIQYLAEMVALCQPTPTLTVYDAVRRLPGGSILTMENERIEVRSYWSVNQFAEPLGLDVVREGPTIVRQLIADSVRLRLSNTGATWAHLSGGLDSSSIVSVAQWLLQEGVVAHGLDGTVTYVDGSNTDSDERHYSDAVVERWRVPNEVIVDAPRWVDERIPPPRLDQPNGILPWYPREARVCEIIRRAGGRVLLTGFGSDELFTGNMLFFADWIARGRIRAAVREMARWTAIGRISFWQLAHENVVLPLLPASLRPARSIDTGGLLPWITHSAARTYNLRARHFQASALSGRRGDQYHADIRSSVRAIAARLDPTIAGESFDVRYPFLYRPLVEFALRAPAELCARPQQRKWVLRESMRGILPEVVRTRIGKGSGVAAISRSVAEQRALLEPLIREPILADLGVVDAKQLAHAFDAAPRQAESGRSLSIDVYDTLAVEAWLQIRAGRWPRGSSH